MSSSLQLVFNGHSDETPSYKSGSSMGLRHKPCSFCLRLEARQYMFSDLSTMNFKALQMYTVGLKIGEWCPTIGQKWAVFVIPYDDLPSRTCLCLFYTLYIVPDTMDKQSCQIAAVSPSYLLIKQRITCALRMICNWNVRRRFIVHTNGCFLIVRCY